MQILNDAAGPHLLLAFEEADAVRAALTALGLGFREPDPSGAGCAGPVWVRLDLEAEAVGRAGGAGALSGALAERLARDARESE